MPERRRSTRSQAAGRGGRSPSRRSESARPSERAPAANKRSSERDATTGQRASERSPSAGKRPSERSAAAGKRPSERSAAAGKRPSSQRSAAAAGKRPSSQRGRATGGRAGSQRRQASEAGEDAGAGRRGSERTRGRQPKRSNLMAYIVVGVVVLLCTAGGIFAAMWPGMQREEILSRLDQASGEAAIAIADEYYDHVGGQDRYINEAIHEQRGPVAARIHLIYRSEDSGQLIRFALTTSDLGPDEIAKAFEHAAMLIDEEHQPEGVVASDRVLEHLVQSERDQVEPALARAAAHLIASLDDDRAVAHLTDAIRDPGVHPAILAGVLDHLHRAIGSDDASVALPIFLGPHADAALQREELLKRITVTVGPGHLDRLFAMLDHESEAIQAVGARFLGGQGMSRISDDQREIVGRRVGAYLDMDTRAAKPSVFSAALDVVQGLRLTGSRDALLALLPELPADHADAEVVATTLGRHFIDADEDRREAAEATLAGLTAALADPDARTIAARALSKVEEPHLANLRAAVEAAIAHAENPAAMAAVHHIIGELYARDELVTRYGDDVAAWQAFIAQDRPQYERFMEIRSFIQEHADARVTDDQAVLDQAWVQVQDYVTMLSGWVEGNGAMPLGLTRPLVEDTLTTLNATKFAIMKARTG